jgi:HPt (histidine-containing phosphotransfer) domain-containing protein
MDARLVALRKTFLRRINDDAMELTEYRSALNGATPQATLTGIRDIAHGLAGAGGIFGFPEIGDAASAVEDGIAQHDGLGSVEGIARSLDRLLDRLEACRSPGKAPSHSRLDA